MNMRSISAFRRRGALSALGPVLLVVSMLLSTGTAAAAASPAAAVSSAQRWLLGQQAADGGFIGFSGTSDMGATTDAVIALASAPTPEGAAAIAKAMAFLKSGALVYTQAGVGQAAKLVLAVVAAGGDPRDVGKVDPLAIVEQTVKTSAGLYGNGVYDHALAMLAQVAAGGKVAEKALKPLSGAQNEDGSWAFDGSKGAATGDTNTTAVVVQALAAAGFGASPMIPKALAYLHAVQKPEGGFGFQGGDAALADANSTALVVQGVIAAGQDPSSAEWKNATGALLAFQNPGGAFRYQLTPPDDNLFATLQAVPALAGKALPVRAAGAATPIATCLTPTPLNATPQAELDCAA